MIIEDVTPKGYLHRWTLVQGEPRCVEDAVLVTDPIAPQVLGRNAVVRSLVEEADTLAAALAASDDETVEAASDLARAVLRARAGEEAPEIDAALDAAEPIAPVLPVPTVISDRQFFHALALIGVISKEEALDAVRTGAIPQLILDFIEQLPEEQQFGAEMLLSGAVEFHRDHPMVAVLSQGLGWTSDKVDDLFRLAASL